MNICWLGHSSFLLTTESGVKVLTDPYKPGVYSGQLSYASIREEADIVTISHSHMDHNYAAELPGNPRIISSPIKQEIKGVIVEGISVFHDSCFGRERGKNIIFVIEADDLRLCHFGDLGHLLTEKQEQLIRPVDIALVPIGGRFTIDAEQATELVEKLGVKVAIPMHFRTDKCKFPISTVDEFTKNKKQVVNLEVSKIRFAKENLPQELTVFVLSYAN